MLLIPWVVFHVLVCIALVLVVLMQSSKGEGLAGGTAFGGAMSSAVFGGRGTASFLSKATTVLAILFMLNCGALAFMSRGQQVVTTTGTTGEMESAVTRQARQEQEAAMAAQAAQQEALMADSAARQGAAPVQVVPAEQAPATPQTEPSGE